METCPSGLRCNLNYDILQDLQVLQKGLILGLFYKICKLFFIKFYIVYTLKNHITRT